MLVSSASHSPYAHRATAASIAEQAASPSAAPEAAPTSGVKGQFFSRGRFVGLERLTSPQVLAALFQMNADGSVAHAEGGAPVLKGAIDKGGPDWIARMLAQDRPETWSDADRRTAQDLARITDDDKAMFRKLTGYNLFTAGPLSTIVDDDGNPPPEADRAAVDELFTRLRSARAGGETVDASWFRGLARDIADRDAGKLPAQWRDKADEWFDDLFEARQGMDDGADRLMPVTNVLERLQMAIAAHAYGEAAGLGTAA